MSCHHAHLDGADQGRPTRMDRFFRLAANAALALPARLARALRRRHTRQVLAALDDHQLRDIGVTRAEISKL